MHLDGGMSAAPMTAVGTEEGLLPRVDHVVTAEIRLIVEIFTTQRTRVFLVTKLDHFRVNELIERYDVGSK